MSYSAGGIVVLKSGGPAMTVISATETEVECIWMSDVGELSRETIPAIALEPVEIDEDEEDGDEDDDFDDEDEEGEEDQARAEDDAEEKKELVD